MSREMTVSQVAAGFGVSTMTLYLWRRGTPTKEMIPHYIEPVGVAGKRITFDLAEVKEWARQNSLAFNPNGVKRKPGQSGPIAKVAKRVEKKKVKH